MNDFEKELDGTFDGLIEYHRAIAGKRRKETTNNQSDSKE